MSFKLPGFTYAAARFDRLDGDVVMNGFWFDTSQSNDQAVIAALESFYFEPVPNTGPAALIDMLSPRLAGGQWYLRDADQIVGTPGRDYPMAGPFKTDPTYPVLPPDVAIAASYRAAPPSTQRRAGRIFLGPLSRDVQAPGLSYAVVDDDGRISAGVRDLVNGAVERLAVNSTFPGAWGIASRVGLGAFAPVTRGYVDQHFDTQRRRDPGTQTFGRHPDDWPAATV